MVWCRGNSISLPHNITPHVGEGGWDKIRCDCVYVYSFTQFHGSTPLDSQEYYNLPHWINYSFYNPVHPWDWYRYRPMLKLSDHLVSCKA